MWLEIFFIISRDRLLERNIDKSRVWSKGNLQLIALSPEERKQRDQFFESHNPSESKKPADDDIKLVQKIATDSLKIDTEVRKALESINKKRDK